MSSRRALRVSQGVTNAGGTSRFQRPGTPSAQLTARLSSRSGGALLRSASTPVLGQHRINQLNNHQGGSKAEEDDSPLPPLGGTDGVPPRPSTTTGAFGRPSPSDRGPKELGVGESGRLFTPPRSSPGLTRKDAGYVSGKGHDNSDTGATRGSSARSPLYPTNATNGRANGGAGGGPEEGGSGIPLGLSRLGREDLEVYVNVVRATLAKEAKKNQAVARKHGEAIKEVAAVQMGAAKSGQQRILSRGGNRGDSRGTARGAGEGREGGRGRKAPRRSSGIGRRTSALDVATMGVGSEGGTASSGSSTKVCGDGGSGSEMKWFSRSRISKTDPLRTLMLDSEVNNIPHVGTQSHFRALIKAQNIPHPSYDIDGDGVVSQEDYALAKRIDVNGDGILDEAEQIVGRRIMTEMFLENHQHDIHLYGGGLSKKSMVANVDDISRSRGFKKVISGLREKEKNFVHQGSDGVTKCVTLKPESLTRHNFFNNKFDTTAWNDFTRDPRDAGWLESRRHDGSRNQMYFMRKAEARESAQGKLNASYKRDDAFFTRRITLITDPAVENC